MADEPELAIVAKLLRMKPVAPAVRRRTVRTSDTGRPVSVAVPQNYGGIPANPDGPEAAAIIKELFKTLREVRPWVEGYEPYNSREANAQSHDLAMIDAALSRTGAKQ